MRSASETQPPLSDFATNTNPNDDDDDDDEDDDCTQRTPSTPLKRNNYNDTNNAIINTMDHAERIEADTPPTRISHLHRGALREIQVDRLKPTSPQNNARPLHRQADQEWTSWKEAAIGFPPRRASLTSPLEHEWKARRFEADIWPSRLNANTGPPVISSEPPHKSFRGRCASGEMSHSPVKRLFIDGEEEDTENYHTTRDTSTSTSTRRTVRPWNHQESDILALPTTEAFALKTELRRRRQTSPTRTNNNSQPERAALMDSIRGDDGRSPRAQRPRSYWVVPIDHPLKTVWDIMTVVLSIANAYAMHVSIRERKIGGFNAIMAFCDVWFLLDILLNFVTEHKTADGEILRDYRSIFARYLTSWFAVDALALFPWETLYIKPIIELQNRRGFWKRSFFRSKAVVRVTRHLRGKHVRWFGTVARHSKLHGVGAKRLLRLIIKYVPKYLLWFRSMKGVVAFRFLRQFQWFRRFYNNHVLGKTDEKSDGMTGSITTEEFDEGDDLSSKPPQHAGENHHRLGGTSSHRPLVQVVYEPWELMDDDDDGVPL